MRSRIASESRATSKHPPKRARGSRMRNWPSRGPRNLPRILGEVREVFHHLPGVPGKSGENPGVPARPSEAQRAPDGPCWVQKGTAGAPVGSQKVSNDSRERSREQQSMPNGPEFPGKPKRAMVGEQRGSRDFQETCTEQYSMTSGGPGIPRRGPKSNRR